MARTLIALGSNLGDRLGGLDDAIEKLSEMPGVQWVAKATPVETAPIGVPDSDASFFNSAAMFDVSLPARDWLELLLATERHLGRQRSVRWGARRIDLDLLLFDQEIHDERPLRVPHPRMGFRRFVMRPAAEIAAEMWHPTCTCTIGELASHLDHAPNWIAWPELKSRPECQEPLARNQARKFLPADATPDQWLAVSQWLQAAPTFGPDARVVVVQRWPDSQDPLRKSLPQLPLTPKLAIQSWQGLDPYHSIVPQTQSAVRLRLPLESDELSEILRDVDAAIEAMISA